MSKKFAITAFFLLILFASAPIKSFAILNDFEASEIFSADSAKILTKEAKIIIKGEVKSVKLSKGINDVIYARASVLVNEVIKGKVAKKNITVEYKEGETDDFGLLTKNTPSFEQGEVVILFLTNSFWRKNVYYLVGDASGKYAICADDTVVVRYSCDEENQEAENIISDEILKTEIATADKKETLEELLSEIKNVE